MIYLNLLMFFMVIVHKKSSGQLSRSAAGWLREEENFYVTSVKTDKILIHLQYQYNK